jgi:ferritin-like metal-binding protein YciE
MAKAAQSQELKAAFEKHENETEEHVARLEKVFEEIEETPRGKSCDAIMGIIEEGQEVMKEFRGACNDHEHHWLCKQPSDLASTAQK